MDKGKEEPSKSLQGSNSYKKQKMETTSDQEEDDQMEQAGRRFKTKETTAEFQKRESMAAVTAAGNKESEGTEATIDIEALDETETEDTEDTEGELDEAETEYTEEETVLSPKESSTNNPKGMKMNVEQAAENNQDEELILSPKESSTGNGMKKKKRVREEEDKDKKSKGDSSSADTCTSKFPTSLDFNKDESMRSPPGDQGSSCGKNL